MEKLKSDLRDLQETMKLFNIDLTGIRLTYKPFLICQRYGISKSIEETFFSVGLREWLIEKDCFISFEKDGQKYELSADRYTKTIRLSDGWNEGYVSVGSQEWPEFRPIEITLGYDD